MQRKTWYPILASFPQKPVVKLDQQSWQQALKAYSPNIYTVPMSIPLLSKVNRGFRAVSSTITDTYLSIGDSFSDSVFRDLKRSSVKPWGARTKVNGDKTLSGGRINWSHSRSDWKKSKLHKGPSLHYVRTFLDFFWPIHLPYVCTNSTERQQKLPFFWPHLPSPFADVV